MNKISGALVVSACMTGCASTIVDTHYAYRVEGEQEFTSFVHGGWNCGSEPVAIDVSNRVTVYVRGFEAKEPDIVISLLGKNTVFADEVSSFLNTDGTFVARPYKRDSNRPWYRAEPEYFYCLKRPVSEGTLVFPDLVIDGSVRKLPPVEFHLRTGPRKDLTTHWVCNTG